MRMDDRKGGMMCWVGGKLEAIHDQWIKLLLVVPWQHVEASNPRKNALLHLFQSWNFALLLDFTYSYSHHAQFYMLDRSVFVVKRFIRFHLFDRKLITFRADQ